MRTPESSVSGTEILRATLIGTHSSGKSTLRNSLETAELTDIGIGGGEYEDFGYGVWTVGSGSEAEELLVVTVPEAARWLADQYNKPSKLAEDYTFDFQREIDFHTIMRRHKAESLVSAVLKKLDLNSGQPRVAVVSDRSALDGVVYSGLRIPEQTDHVGGSAREGYTGVPPGTPNSQARTGVMSEWLNSFIDQVYIVDHTEVPFESDDARLADSKFRERVAEAIAINYAELHFGEPVIIRGNETERKDKMISHLGSTCLRLEEINAMRNQRRIRPYSEWGKVTATFA